MLSTPLQSPTSAGACRAGKLFTNTVLYDESLFIHKAIQGGKRIRRGPYLETASLTHGCTWSKSHESNDQVHF